MKKTIIYIAHFRTGYRRKGATKDLYFVGPEKKAAHKSKKFWLKSFPKWKYELIKAEMLGVYKEEPRHD